MKQNQKITHEPDDHDSWVCACGNRPITEGFYPSDSEGNQVEPEPGWGGLFSCSKCGRIINSQTLEIVGRKVMN